MVESGGDRVKPNVHLLGSSLPLADDGAPWGFGCAIQNLLTKNDVWIILVHLFGYYVILVLVGWKLDVCCLQADAIKGRVIGALPNYQKGVRQMKKLVLVAILLLGICSVAVAQDVPTAEIFGGYSFYRCANDSDSCDLQGWNAAVDLNFNKNWAATVDVSGHYGWLDVPATANYDAYDDVKNISFLFGPKYTFSKSERVRPYLHALFGLNHVNPEPQYTVENNFAMAYGGGIDVKVNDKISVRPVQLDYVGVRRFSVFENNLRYSAGIVFKFGSR
jgi:opacity protein-like surface antigen